MPNKAYPYDFLSGRLMAEDGTFVNIADEHNKGTTFFNEAKSVERTSQLILNANVPLSSYRDNQTTANGGTVSSVGSEYRVRADSTTNSSASLQTRQRGNYISGNVLECGMGIRIPTQPTGDAYIRWGYFRGDTGMYFRYDSQGIWVVVEDGGTIVEEKLQSDWNRDTMDGTDNQSNGSGEELDLSTGRVFQIDFVYYGYGPVRFDVQGENSSKYALIPVHTFNRLDGSTTIQEPNLSVTIEVNSGTSGQQLDCFVGGRQISVFGKRDPVSRIIGEINEDVSVPNTTPFTPLVSFQRKAGFENILTKLNSINILSTEDLEYRLIKGYPLAGTPNFTTPDGFNSAEIANDFDKAGTAAAGGEVFKKGLIKGGSGNKASITSAELPKRVIYEEDTITLAARSITTNTATVTAELEIEEEW